MRRQIKEFLSFKTLLHLKSIPLIILKIKNWWPFMLNYIGFKDTNPTYKFRDGTIVKTIEGIDAATILLVMIRKDYGNIKDNSIVIDIGANIGANSLFAAKAKNTFVYAYEPMPDTFKVLEENIKSNNFGKRIRAYNLAVCGKKGKRKLYLSTSSPFHSLFQKSKKSIEVNCTTLKDIFNDNNLKTCDILKMDCEGAEYEILFNTPISYLKRIQEIRLEYHNLNLKNNFQTLIKFFKNNNFKIVKLTKDNRNSGILWARNQQR